MPHKGIVQMQICKFTVANCNALLKIIDVINIKISKKRRMKSGYHVAVFKKPNLAATLRMSLNSPICAYYVQSNGNTH